MVSEVAGGNVVHGLLFIAAGVTLIFNIASLIFVALRYRRRLATHSQMKLEAFRRQWYLEQQKKFHDAVGQTAWSNETKRRSPSADDDSLPTCIQIPQPDGTILTLPLEPTNEASIRRFLEASRPTPHPVG